MEYRDRSNWPLAMKEAEKIASNHLDLTDNISLYIYPQRIGDHFNIVAVESGKSFTVPEGLKLSKDELEDYLQWNYECQHEKYMQGRRSLAADLREAGYYKKESSGLQLAFKLYELLGMAGRPVSKSEILQEEADTHRMAMKYGIELAGAVEIMRLPDLGANGKMSDRASRALRNLVSAGIVKRTGMTNRTVYSL